MSVIDIISWAVFAYVVLNVLSVVVLLVVVAWQDYRGRK